MNDPLRLVLVSYAFPPVGGAGVQRAVKLVKYLPNHGVTPTVLTTANPSVPLSDESLLRDIPEGTRILRARTFEPGYGMKQAAWKASADARPSLSTRIRRSVVQVGKEALVPDPQVLWQPAANAALARHLVADRPDVVMVSGPPFSSFLLTLLSRLSPRTRVILDYRDEWTAYTVDKSGEGANFEMVPTFARSATRALETTLLRMCHGVTTATEAFRQNLLKTFPFLSEERVVAIPNGYDPDDMPSPLPEPPADMFTLTYAGTIFRLTSPQGLLAAVKRLHERAPDLASLLRLRFFGRIVDTENKYFEGVPGVERPGYIAHDQVLPELARSHMVLCLLDDVPGTERIYPAKIFELMKLGRPVLTLSPDGALTDLVKAHDMGAVLPPRDVDGIAALLAQSLTAFRAGTYQTTHVARDVARYHRDALAGEVADFARRLRAAS